MISNDVTDLVKPNRAIGLDIALFAGTLFVSAFLLFAVQPMFAKMVLPSLGGAPAVWSVAMVFFQAALLAGYGYAHWLTSRVSIGRAAIIHVAVMIVAAFALPIGVYSGLGEPPQAYTEIWLFALFAASVGLPFFAVSGNGPLLQAWFRRTGHPHAADPYFLYGASNLGSFAALLLYPVLIEPAFGAKTQASVWMFGYGLLGALVATCAITAVRGKNIAPALAPLSTAADVSAPGMKTRAIWVGLSFLPSALLVGVTAHISTDIAAAPFLWVMPLALFLLTFVITFQRNPWLKPSWMLALQGPTICAVLLSMASGLPLPLPISIVLHLGGFFIVAMVCHGELVRRRPDSRHLTEFYLLMSFGGVLGGIFASLIAPNAFNTVVEYPLILVLSLAANPAIWRRDRAAWISAGLIAGGLLVVLGTPPLFGYRMSSYGIAFVVMVPILWGFVSLQRGTPPRFAMVLLAAMAVTALHVPATSDSFTRRSFFGVHKVATTTTGEFRVLFHGTTLHGAERIRQPDGTPVVGRPEPSTYYWYGSPIGEAITVARQLHGGRLERLAAVGLGTGSIACHRQSAENWTFYEIDPLVVEIARDPKLFRYLPSCAPDQEVILGDARLTLTKTPDKTYQAIVVDAFSSDAIPSHLLTADAVDTYFRKLDDTGFVVFHVSNRHMELSRVLAAVAQTKGYVVYGLHRAPSAKGETEYFAPSSVAVMARRIEHLGSIGSGGVWAKVEPKPGQRPWTDDYSNLLEPIWRLNVLGDSPLPISKTD